MIKTSEMRLRDKDIYPLLVFFLTYLFIGCGEKRETVNEHPENGKLVEKSYVQNGKEVRYWVRAFYKNGKLSGPYTTYYDTLGHVIMTTFMEDGSEIGPSRHYTRDGILRDYTEYHLGTRVHSIGFTENGDTIYDQWHGSIICPDTIPSNSQVNVKIKYVQDVELRDIRVNYCCIPVEMFEKFANGKIKSIPTIDTAYNPDKGITFYNLQPGPHVIRVLLNMKTAAGQKRYYYIREDRFVK